MTGRVHEVIAAGWLEPSTSDLPRVVVALLNHLELRVLWTNHTPQGLKHNVVELVVESDG